MDGIERDVRGMMVEDEGDGRVGVDDPCTRVHIDVNEEADEIRVVYSDRLLIALRDLS